MCWDSEFAWGNPSLVGEYFAVNEYSNSKLTCVETLVSVNINGGHVPLAPSWGAEGGLGQDLNARDSHGPDRGLSKHRNMDLYENKLKKTLLTHLRMWGTGWKYLKFGFDDGHRVSDCSKGIAGFTTDLSAYNFMPINLDKYRGYW